ncbi:EAL domain-containing protein [Aerococcaceae bacterium DSM 111176]|nr:EAL domain-containing protein [Aerococcaceae bacterium DSM 111176]
MIDHQTEIDQNQMDRIINQAIEKGEIGLLNWYYNSEKLEFVEGITGYAPELINNLPDFVYHVIDEQDKDTILRLFKRYQERLPKSLEITMRIRSKDGKFKQVLFRGEIDSETQCYFGVLYNVTTTTYDGTPMKQMMGYRIFLARVRNLMSANQNNNTKSALIGLSVTNYKSLINNYRTNITEEVMRSFTDRILSHLKPVDEISRFSDELLFIWINNYSEIKEIKDLINCILEDVGREIPVENVEINLHLSIGVALFPDDAQDIDTLIKYADYALVQAQSRGFNHSLFFDKEISKAYHLYRSIELALPNAVKNNELAVHYQPQMDPWTNQIIGIEALVRWSHPEIGNIPPNSFIELAESKGYIHEIGYWVMEETIKTAKEWLDDGYEFSTISINISPLQIEQATFREELLDLCERYQMPKDKLELEITEGTLLEQVDQNVDNLKKLRADHFKIALDDFGTGYSNFSSVLNFPITSVKIDKSMVDNVTEDRDFMVLSGVIALAKSLNYQIVLEGVETEEQLNIVRELGCDRIQGFYFSRALTKEAMADMLHH